jgi:hypothetical protein
MSHFLRCDVCGREQEASSWSTHQLPVGWYELRGAVVAWSESGPRAKVSRQACSRPCVIKAWATLSETVLDVFAPDREETAPRAVPSSGGDR